MRLMTNSLLCWVKHGLHVGAGQFKQRAKVWQEYLGSEGGGGSEGVL